MADQPWQQPIRPMELQPNVEKNGTWYPVMFFRVWVVFIQEDAFTVPWKDEGWEAMTTGGNVWNNKNAMIREVAHDRA